MVASSLQCTLLILFSFLLRLELLSPCDGSQSSGKKQLCTSTRDAGQALDLSEGAGGKAAAALSRAGYSRDLQHIVQAMCAQAPAARPTAAAVCAALSNRHLHNQVQVRAASAPLPFPHQAACRAPALSLRAKV